MELTHRFTVPAPLEHAWSSFNDLQALAPCLPGLRLSGVDKDRFSGRVKIKIGSTALVFDGDGRFVERDRGRHRLVITAQGSDVRGRGEARVRLTLVLRGNGEQSTSVDVRSDTDLTGRASRFGAGGISEVGRNLVSRFADCLSDRFESGSVQPNAGYGGAPAGSGSARVIRDSEPVATGVGPIGGGAQSGGASGVTGASSGTATPPGAVSEAEAHTWTPAGQPDAADQSRSVPGLIKHYLPSVLAGVTLMGLVVSILRRLRPN